jgi:hypothetical protein
VRARGVLVNTDLGLADEIDALGGPPKRKRGQPELLQQAAIVKALTTALPPGTVVFRVENAAAPRGGASPGQRMNFHASRKRAGMQPGFPDLGALLPGGRAMLFEVKSKTGVADERQLELHAHIRGLGFPVAIVRDAAEAVDAVRAAGLTPRKSRLDP